MRASWGAGCQGDGASSSRNRRHGAAGDRQAPASGRLRIERLDIIVPRQYPVAKSAAAFCRVVRASSTPTLAGGAVAVE
jgi:hypothetical protein